MSNPHVTSFQKERDADPLQLDTAKLDSSLQALGIMDERGDEASYAVDYQKEGTRLVPIHEVTVFDAQGNAVVYRIIGQKLGPGVAGLHPLRLVKAGPNQIRILYGTLADRAPEGMSPGDVPPYVLNVIGAGKVFGQITRDSGSGDIVGCAIITAEEKPEDTDTVATIELGSWSINNEGVLSVAQAVSGSQAYQYCGGEHLWGLI